MSHNITPRDGLFVVRQPAWHGLGVVLPDHPSREQAQAIAHPWEPITEPLYRITTDPETGKTKATKISEYELVVRDDSKAPIGVKPQTRSLVTNTEMYDIAEAIEGEDPSTVLYETGGSLKGGAKVWLLLRLKEPLIVPGDPNGGTIMYYALQNAMDGSGSFRGQATSCRIVCDNTSQFADWDARMRGTEFVFRHTSGIRDRIEEARHALAGWRESIGQWALLAEHLITMDITPAQRTLFVEKFVPAPPPHAASDRVMNNVEEARQAIRDILASETCQGIDDTVYGLVQASVEYLNHARRARSDESRFKRSYLDRNTIVADALRIGQEVALS